MGKVAARFGAGGYDKGKTRRTRKGAIRGETMITCAYPDQHDALPLCFLRRHLSITPHRNAIHC